MADMVTIDNKVEDETEEPNGLKRVKAAFLSSDNDLYKNASLATGVASIIGFCIGGRIGARSAGSDHIIGNQLKPYSSKMQAHREYHSAVVDGFVRNGSRWGWRAGVFAGLYSTITTVLAEYRNKYDGLNIVLAGGATGATYKVLSGVRGIIVGTILGSLFSLPIAVVVQTVTWAVPEDFKENIREVENEKKDIKRNHLEPWQRNLGVTEKMVQQMESELDDLSAEGVNPK